MLEILGVPVLSGLLILGIVALQTLGGMFVWLAARKGSIGLSEALGMGFALGSVIATLGAQISVFLASNVWGWLLAPLLGGLAWLGSRTGWWESGSVAGISWRGVWLFTPVVLIGVLALVPSILLTPLRGGYVVGAGYQPDVVFFEAVAQSVSTWGAADSSMLVGEPIRYHWLSYGWIGSLTAASAAGDFVVMTRIFPVLMVFAAALLAASWARALSRVWWVPGLAALLVVGGGYVGASQGVALTYDSPSTAYAVVLGLAFGLMLSVVLRPGGGPVGLLLVLLGLLSFALVGAKASQALVIAVGVAAVAIWALATRSLGRIWPLVLASASGMLLGYFAFLLGVAGDETNIGLSGTQEHASTFQRLDPFEGGLGIALGSFALMLAILPRWLGASWLAGRLPGEFAFGIGLAFAGVGTVAVLRSGTNAAWFALGSTALLSVLAAVGVGIALERVGYSFPSGRWRRDPIVWALVTALVINALVLLAYALAAVSGAPVLWRGPLIAWVVSLGVAFILARSSSLVGGRWLRWAAMVTVIITITSIGARANGSIVWGLAHSRATPIVQDFIRFLDADAEFTSQSASRQEPARGALRSASAAIRSPEQSRDGAGVARSGGTLQWTPGMNDAALRLREVSDARDIVAVSRPNLQPFLPIVSQRRAWVAGLPYSTGYTTSDGIATAEERISAVEQLLTNPEESLVEGIVDSGVGWLWITPESFGALPGIEPWTQVIYSDADVVLLRVTAAGANSS